MYDFEDPLVRELVERCHVPFEQVIAGSDGSRVLELLCEKDHLPWPCPAREELMRWLADRFREAQRDGRAIVLPPLDK